MHNHQLWLKSCETLPTSGWPTSLDPLETPVSEKKRSPLTAPLSGRTPFTFNGHVYPECLGRPFRHSSWQHFRIRVACAMYEVYGISSAVDAFCNCGERMIVLKSTSDPTLHRVVPSSCKSRWCKPCYATRAALLRTRLAARLDNRPVRFVTLTLRASDESLKSVIDRLYKSFRALRVLPIWKNRVFGGAAFLEVKRGENSGGWHAHLHMLTQGRYLPQADLSKAWLSVTGDSPIVDIRIVRDRRCVLQYVTKYATKSNGLDSSLADADLVEIVSSLRGRRTIITFGTWKSYALLHQEPGDEWEMVGWLGEVEIAAANGDTVAESILDAWHNCLDPDTGCFHVVTDADG